MLVTVWQAAWTLIRDGAVAIGPALAIFVASAMSSLLTLLIKDKSQAKRDIAATISNNDRRVAELNEDLRRWITDRDHQAQIRMGEVRNLAVRQGVVRGGTLPAAAGKMYRIALHEYRAQASRLQREWQTLADAEGLAHARRRRRNGKPFADLRVNDVGRRILGVWREKAEHDPSAEAIEPQLALLERAA